MRQRGPLGGGQEKSGATTPRKHFVVDDQRAGGVRGRMNRFQPTFWGLPHATPALYRLDQNGGCMGKTWNGPPPRGDVVVLS